MLCGCGNKIKQCKCFAPRRCKTCRGIGTAIRFDSTINKLIPEQCTTCKGTGKVIPDSLGG